VDVRYVVEAKLVSRAHRSAGLIYSYNLLSKLPDFKIFLIFEYSIQQLMSFYLLFKNVMIEISRTTILPFFLSGSETWSAAFREEHRPRAYENRALRRIFWTKREKIGEWRQLHSEELRDLYAL